MNPLALLKLIPSWAYALAIAVLLFTNAVQHFKIASLTTAVAESKLELAKEQVTIASLITNIQTANRKAAEDTAFLVKKAATAADEGRKREKLLQLAKSDLDTELNSLRHSTMSSRATYRITGTPLSSVLVAADTAYDLFDQCSAAYADLATKADAHASDVVTLLAAWPVLPAVPKPEPPK